MKRHRPQRNRELERHIAAIGDPAFVPSLQQPARSSRHRADQRRMQCEDAQCRLSQPLRPDPYHRAARRSERTNAEQHQSLKWQQQAIVSQVIQVQAIQLEQPRPDRHSAQTEREQRIAKASEGLAHAFRLPGAIEQDTGQKLRQSKQRVAVENAHRHIVERAGQRRHERPQGVEPPDAQQHQPIALNPHQSGRQPREAGIEEE